MAPGISFVKKMIPIANNERNGNMKTYKSVIVALLLGALLGTGLLGCNTFRGAGRDIERGGQGIQNAADGAQGK
jgi:entericidin B